MTLDLFPGVVYSIYFSIWFKTSESVGEVSVSLFPPLSLFHNFPSFLSFTSFLPSFLTWFHYPGLGDDSLIQKIIFLLHVNEFFFCLFCESTLQTVDYYFYFFLFIFFNIFKKIFLQSARNCVAGMEVITSFAESLLPPPPEKKHAYIFVLRTFLKWIFNLESRKQVIKEKTKHVIELIIVFYLNCFMWQSCD